MAKEAKPEAEVAPAPKKSKKLMIIMAILLVLVLLIVGGGAMLLMKMHAASADEEGDVTSETVKAEKKSDAKEIPPTYVALDAFTVNLVGDQFLQLMISVEVADLATGDRLKNFTPKIRNNVMMLLSGKSAADLITKEGKETLATEILDLINEILEPGSKGDQGPVKEVLFTSFIIQ